MKINYYIKLLRPHQYIKNVLIFAPIFFDLKILDFNLLLRTSITFVAFSLVASAVYIFNDFLDIEADRMHPKKRLRPLAANQVSKKTSIILLLICLIAGEGIALSIDKSGFILLTLYAALNVLYSMFLKHIAIVDVMIIAVGFVIRIFVGSVTTNINLSMWIVSVTFLLALFLALAKRRDDVLISTNGGTIIRKVIDGYNIDFVNVSMAMTGAVTMVSYMMYTVSDEAILKMNSDKLYLTSFFVILGLLRYFQITLVENKSGNPTELFLTDKFLQITIISWIGVLSLILYH